MTTNCIGPFIEEYKLEVDGFRVPYLTARPLDPLMTKWCITLDERFGLDIETDRLQDIIPFIANAMAVAAGYTSHGENCQPTNPFHVRMMGIGEINSEGVEIKP
jgi:hypothetical protein